MAWRPDFSLNPCWRFSGLILVLHGLAVWSLLQVGWKAALPLVVLSGVYQCALVGWRRLPWSVQRIRLTPRGWFLITRRGRETGPFELAPASRLDLAFIRLSLHRPGHWGSRHLILTRSIIGPDNFRRLQRFLRWAPEKNQPIDK